MAERRSITVWISDQRWRVRRCRVPSDRHGDCDYDKHLIRVSQSLRGDDLLEVLVHELIHARWPDLSEEAVEEFGQEIAAVVTAFGFVREEDADG
jgi:hypothetical protein